MGDVIDKTTKVPLFLAISVIVSAIGSGVWVGRTAQQVENRLARIERKIQRFDDQIVGGTCVDFNRTSMLMFGKLFDAANKERKPGDPIVWPDVWDIPGPDGKDCL